MKLCCNVAPHMAVKDPVVDHVHVDYSRFTSTECVAMLTVKCNKTMARHVQWNCILIMGDAKVD